MHTWIRRQRPSYLKTEIDASSIVIESRTSPGSTANALTSCRSARAAGGLVPGDDRTTSEQSDQHAADRRRTELLAPRQNDNTERRSRHRRNAHRTAQV
jgi:hypothetical protein